MQTLFAVVDVLVMVLQWVIWTLVIWSILSWLVAFNIINMHNNVVRSVMTGLDQFFKPMLRPIRRILPDMGGIDLSPMVLILVIILLQRVVPAMLIDLSQR